MFHEEPEEHVNHERWLVSYADFITLLMVFFVVMYAMSNVDAKKYEQMATSLNAALAGTSGGSGILEGNNQMLDLEGQGSSLSNQPSEPPTEGTTTAEQTNLATAAEELKTYFEQEGLSADVSMSFDERGLVISLNDTLLFDAGSATIKPEAASKIVKIGETVNKLPNYVRIEGHTDNQPIHTAQFPSNWELSVIRATNVTKLILEQVPIAPERVVVVGYSQYKPVSNNDTPEGRSKNRRVDIIVLDTKYNALEK